MRIFYTLILFATACTEFPLSGPQYDSVRERMSDAPTSLYVHDESSTGTIGARRRGSDGWIAGTTDIAIERGYLRAAIDDGGQLAIDQLTIDLAPISLDGVFSKPAHLEGVQLRLAGPARSDAAWASSDDAAASLLMTFDFDWSIVIGDADPYPLATQQLPPQRVDVVLTGDGDHVEAAVNVAASGELWNWADLIEITDLTLALTAETAD